jgi:hypothetical protein
MTPVSTQLSLKMHRAFGKLGKLVLVVKRLLGNEDEMSKVLLDSMLCGDMLKSVCVLMYA